MLILTNLFYPPYPDFIPMGFPYGIPLWGFYPYGRRGEGPPQREGFTLKPPTTKPPLGAREVLRPGARRFELLTFVV